MWGFGSLFWVLLLQEHELLGELQTVGDAWKHLEPIDFSSLHKCDQAGAHVLTGGPEAGHVCSVHGPADVIPTSVAGITAC